MSEILLLLIMGLFIYYAGKHVSNGIIMGTVFCVATFAVYLVLNYVLYFDFTEMTLPETFIVAEEAITKEINRNEDYIFKPIKKEDIENISYFDYSYIDDKLYLKIKLDKETIDKTKSQIDNKIDEIYVDIDTLTEASLSENVTRLSKLLNVTTNKINGVKIKVDNEQLENGVKYKLTAENIKGHIKIIYQSERIMGVWEEFDSEGNFELENTFDSKIKLQIYQDKKLIYDKYED